MGHSCQLDAVVEQVGVPLPGCHPDFGVPVAKGGSPADGNSGALRGDERLPSAQVGAVASFMQEAGVGRQGQEGRGTRC